MRTARFSTACNSVETDKHKPAYATQYIHLDQFSTGYMLIKTGESEGHEAKGAHIIGGYGLTGPSRSQTPSSAEISTAISLLARHQHRQQIAVAVILLAVIASLVMKLIVLGRRHEKCHPRQ